MISTFRRLGVSLGVCMLCCCLTACGRASISLPEEAMRPTAAPALKDDLGLESLSAALEQEIIFLRQRGIRGEYTFGERRLSKERYLDSLERLSAHLITAPDETAVFNYIRQHFDFLEVYGDRGWGDVLITSYYEPVIPGSLLPTAEYSQALYRKPPELSQPYLSREQIDSEHALSGRGLEICYVDPVDAFFLQIQGSGVVRLADGRELRLQFAGKNGLPYHSLGPAIRKQLPNRDLTLPVIESFLRSLCAEQRAEILNTNPSYVFFEPSADHALTAMQIPASAGRTIATDGGLFPKGALAFLEFSRPVFNDAACVTPQFRPVSRFVLDQDVGSAIRGPGRVDLFWGRGPEAKRSAGVIKSRGRLYYLLPKEEEF
jgi:membrane-bound lytic murein transglycosylase A